MTDLDKIKESLKKMNSTLKTLKVVDRIAKMGVFTVDKLTDGKATTLLNQIQDKMDKSFALQLEEKFVQLDKLLDEKIGKPLNDKIDQVEKAIDAKGGKKIEQFVQKTADTLEGIYKGTALPQSVTKIDEKITEIAEKGIETVKIKVNELKTKKTQTKSTKKSSEEVKK